MSDSLIHELRQRIIELEAEKAELEAEKAGLLRQIGELRGAVEVLMAPPAPERV